MKSRGPASWSLAAVAALVALGLYVGLYLALCVRTPFAMGFQSGSDIFYSQPEYLVSYRFEPRVMSIVFQPVEKLDRRLFPERWKVTTRGYWSPAPGPSPTPLAASSHNPAP